MARRRRHDSDGFSRESRRLTRTVIGILFVLLAAAANWLWRQQVPSLPTNEPPRTALPPPEEGRGNRGRRGDPASPLGPGGGLPGPGREPGRAQPTPPRRNINEAAIGTFNLEWFSLAGKNARTDEDLQAVAEVIRNTGMSLIGLQEIDDEAVMERLVSFLPGWRFVLGTSGREQRCAILWDGSVASVGRASEWPDINEGLERSEGTLRAPLVAEARVGKFDFLFVVVHLKAMFDERSLRMRRTQIERLRERLDEWTAQNDEKDVIIVGDFNDFADSPAMAPLTGATRGRGGAGFINTGARLPESAVTYISRSGRIDHVVISSPAVSQQEWTSKAFTYPKPRGAERKAYEGAVSDHLPAWATFNVSRDNDP